MTTTTATETTKAKKTRSKPHRYLCVWPRRFANDFTIYKVDPKDLLEMRIARSMYPSHQDEDELVRGYDAQWVTRREAYGMVSAAIRFSHQWGGDQYYGDGIVPVSAAFNPDEEY